MSIREIFMRTNTFIQHYIQKLIRPNDLVVDMTLGNGNDAAFLATLTDRVIGFDISQEAIDNSSKRLPAEVKLIKDSHHNVDRYINEPVRLFIFNLGYLPNSQNISVTGANTSLCAIKKAYQLLADGAYLIITFYKGHPGGLEEYQLLKAYIQNNDFNIVGIYRSYDHCLEPETYIIRK